MGGVDGVITSFAIVAGATFVGEATTTVVVIGFSSVVADGLSMGISEYLSSSTEAAVTKREGHPLLLGTLCFFCFVACGSVPLLVFLVARQRLLACAAFSLVELMLLGAGQAFVVREAVLRGLARTTSLGTAAGLVAYGVAFMAHHVE